MFIGQGKISQIEERAEEAGDTVPYVTVYIDLDTPHTGVITMKAPASMGGLAVGNCKVMIEGA